MKDLNGKTIAILATDGFEKSELLEPQRQLSQAGATVKVISLKSDPIRAWDKTDWGETVEVDGVVSKALVEDYDALVLPGGQINPDLLRVDADAVGFVRNFYQSGKPLAAICHGPWMLIEAGVVRGLKATSYHSIQTDMKNAGANWVDEEVVTDTGIVTSRKPDDLDAFCEKIAEEVAEGRHSQRKAA